MKLTHQVQALIAVAHIHEDLNTSHAYSDLSAVLPRTSPARAAYGAMLVRQQIAAFGLIGGRVFLQAAQVALHDRTGQPLLTVGTA